jgi:hypothetical protein
MTQSRAYRKYNGIANIRVSLQEKLKIKMVLKTSAVSIICIVFNIIYL